jgi:hypothetical protein
LSKLFQFLLLSLEEAVALSKDRQGINAEWHTFCGTIEEALDRIPDAAISHLSVFNWFDFQRDVHDALKEYPDLNLVNGVLGGKTTSRPKLNLIQRVPALNN